MSQGRQAVSGYQPTVSGISVREALKLGALKKARVVAGYGGLDNIIRYVSVIEVPDAVRWFQGYELWITAAYSYRHSEEALVQLVEDLVCADAAALAICYSQRYLGGIPQGVIARADELDLPVLELPLDVKYIEIIAPVMTAIVNRQAHYLDLALKAHVDLESMVLKGQEVEAMVQRVAELLEVPVLLLSPSFQLRCFPLLAGFSSQEVATADWARILDGAQTEMINGGSILVGEAGGRSFTGVPLGTETLRLGYLLALQVGLEEVKTLLLLQCSLPITVKLLLERIRQEAELRLQRDFFDDLLNGEISSEVAMTRAKAYGIDLSGCCCVVVADIDAPARQFLKSGEEDQVQGLKRGLKRLAKSLVETEAEGGLVFCRRDSLVMLPRFSGAKKVEALARAKRLAQRLCQEAASQLAPATVSVGVGAFCADLSGVARGFQTAQAAIEIGRRLRGTNSVHCWEELGPYQLLSSMKGSEEARAFVTRNLGPLLDNGNPRAEELLATLDVFLTCGGNIEQVAARLHLHRNTVRYRLDQIRRLLGRDPLAEPFETQLALALRKLL